MDVDCNRVPVIKYKSDMRKSTRRKGSMNNVFKGEGNKSKHSLKRRFTMQSEDKRSSLMGESRKAGKSALKRGNTVYMKIESANSPRKHQSLV